MAAKSIRKVVPHCLLTFAVSIAAGVQTMPAADLPTWPGVGFAMAGLAPGQTARINALNVGGGQVLQPSRIAQGSCGGGVTFEFYSAAGELLKKTMIPNLSPGKAALLDLSHKDLPKGAARTEVRAVLRFGYSGGAPPSDEMVRLFECNILPSLEIFETATGKTILVLTDAKALPDSSSPRK
jgi:hypothetical protein